MHYYYRGAADLVCSDHKIKVMAKLNDNLTAREQKWLIRIILKDLKISLGEKLVLSCIHQDAIDLFNVCSDLRAVCWKLWDTSKRLPNEDNTVHLFRAFRPMLCNRNKNDFEDIVKAMGSSKKNVSADFDYETQIALTVLSLAQTLSHRREAGWRTDTAA